MQHLFGPDAATQNTYKYCTERLSIELPVASDVDELYRLVGEADRRAICSTLLWDGPEDRSEIEWWVEQCRTSSYGDWGFHWIIRDRVGDICGSEGLVLGAIGTRPLGVPGRGDVGYWLGRSYWRQGLMSEALAGLVKLGSTELGYAKMEAAVFAHNDAGRRLVERAGFELEGVVRRSQRKYGEWVDEALYGLVV